MVALGMLIHVNDYFVMSQRALMPLLDSLQNFFFYGGSQHVYGRSFCEAAHLACTAVLILNKILALVKLSLMKYNRFS